MRPTKAKRKLSEIDFENEDAHIALVSKTQGAANGHNYAIVMKSKKARSPEFIEKVQQVRVTLELPEFLQKFFGMWHEDAEVLAKFFGYVEPEDDMSNEPDDWYENYLMSKLNAFEIMKSLYESEDYESNLNDLEDEEYLALLKDQERLEKAFVSIEKSKAKPEAKTEIQEVIVKQTKATVKPETKNKENMKQENTLETEADLLIKAQYEDKFQAIEKAHQELLAKMQAKEDEFEKFKKEQVIKSKLLQVSSFVKNKEHAEAIAKAGYTLTDEDFTNFVNAIGALAKVADSSDLFVEKGLNLTEDAPAKNSLADKVTKLVNK